MLAERVERVRRAATVREDWFAWLPQAKDQLFAFTQHELEISYTILTISLDDALNVLKKGPSLQAREQARIFGSLFERLAGQIRFVLRAMHDHGAQFGTFPNTAPLRPEFFRTARARQIARGNNLLSFLMLRARSRFLRKLAALEQVVTDLHSEARVCSSQITRVEASDTGELWSRLEVLHYDLNTSLRETAVVLKSFFCVLPSGQMRQFHGRLSCLATPKATVAAPRLGTTVVPSLRRKHDELAPSAANPQAVFPQQHSNEDRDNSGSGHGIPFSRMSPDGISGPNETN